MDSIYYAVGIVAGQLGLVAVVTWVVIQLREGTNAPETERLLDALEREEDELKRAA